MGIEEKGTGLEERVGVKQEGTEVCRLTEGGDAMSREWYNEAEMRKLGIRFKTEEEMKAFIDVIYREFEARVGARVSKYFSNEQHVEFEYHYERDNNKAIQMIREICPNHSEICIQVKKDFDHEIMAFKNQISGVIGGAET